MPAEPHWRLGAGRYALAVSGYWLLDLPPHPAVMGSDVESVSFSSGEHLVIDRPLVVTAGVVRTFEERAGRRPRSVGRIEAGTAIVPIGNFETRPGIQFQAGELVIASVYGQDEFTRLCLACDPVRIVTALEEALEAQHWALRLGVREGRPMTRLVALLERIAEDRGVVNGDELLLEGMPDVRELAVLAGVSRESAIINLEWLIHTGVLRREDCKLWVKDLGQLRAAGRE